MVSSTERILKDVRMLSQLSRMSQQETQVQTPLTFSETEELGEFLTRMLSKAKHEQENSLLIQQQKQALSNINTQLQAMKRYKA
jgi:hypothetical protein